MTYQTIEETIKISETHGGLSEFPVDIQGEITLEKTDIATETDHARDSVQSLSTELREAIDEVIEQYKEEGQ
jgi:signal transduction histidine kinase